MTLGPWLIEPGGIKNLVRLGLLDAEAASDRAKVNDAVLRMVNAALNAPVAPRPDSAPPRRRSRLHSALKLVTFGSVLTPFLRS